MVFRGRPSQGCGECRRKKVRCDQLRPACSQCLKSKDGVACPGYRDQQALKYLDESGEVARKVQKRQALKLGKRESESETSSNSSDSASSSPHGSLESPFSSALAPSLENQGLGYFLTNYVMPDSDLCLGHMQHLLSPMNIRSKTLQVAMESIGLAILANQRRNPSLMAKAHHQYAMALRMTKAHLADPSECRQDRTINAVYLLGLFETMTCSSAASMKSWASHIDGIVALLNVRGSDLLNSEFGWAIFVQARTQILMSCCRTETHVPPIVLTLGHQLSQSRNLSCRIANEVLDIISQLCELRASIKDGSFTCPTSIISSLLALDTCLVSWGAVRSSRWDHITVFDSTQPGNVYDESYSLYKAPWLVATWNIQRAARIFIHETVFAQIDAWHLTSLGTEVETLDRFYTQRSQSLSTITSLASDVCASAPYLLGHHRPLKEQQSNPVLAACGYFLLLPLYLAGSTMGIPHEMRTYVMGRLRYIGWRLGIRQALWLAEFLAAGVVGERKGMGMEMGTRRLG